MTIIKKFEPAEKKNKFPKKYIILATISLLFLTLIEIWASNTVVAFGEKYEKLSTIEKNLKIENLILENEIASNSSLKTIASKSAELGFSKLQSIQYIR
jgi:hypothetical protein